MAERKKTAKKTTHRAVKRKAPVKGRKLSKVRGGLEVCAKEFMVRKPFT